MAHTAECAAPEGSQDRDEWMTVIEMQEYMRASRNKAYDLIWSGEIDSYRLGVFRQVNLSKLITYF